MSIAVSGRGLEMAYGTGAATVRALRGVELDVIAGETLVLMGPSGSGKTTLLSVLSGILTPTAGSVRVFGTEIGMLSRRALAEFRRRHFGYVFQGYNLFGALTAKQNVEVALWIKGVTGPAARREAFVLLERTGIGHRADHLPCDLSGGEKQRVSIARALATGPKVIVADEPTASLDSESGHAVAALLRSVSKETGCTVLIVTHDGRLTDVADRVAYLIDGRIAEPA